MMITDHDLARTQGQDALDPFEFISEEVLEPAFDVLAGLLSTFGCKQPALSKYKATGHVINISRTREQNKTQLCVDQVAWKWLEEEHNFFTPPVKKAALKARSILHVHVISLLACALDP